MRQQLTIERLHSELRQQIVSRSIPPGAKLSESFLCREMEYQSDAPPGGSEAVGVGRARYLSPE